VKRLALAVLLVAIVRPPAAGATVPPENAPVFVRGAWWRALPLTAEGALAACAASGGSQEPRLYSPGHEPRGAVEALRGTLGAQGHGLVPFKLAGPPSELPLLEERIRTWIGALAP
jgi:hypothetical protein